MEYFMMKKTLVVFVSAVFAALCLSAHAWADTVPVGYVSFDVTGANVAEFDITNLTGANSLPPIFPVTSNLDLTDLSLTVNFAGNVSETYGASDFTLGADGISWTGDQFSTLSGPPTGLAGAISATLTGMFVESTAQLSGANVWTVANPNFSATITDPSGFLLDSDLAVIDATVTPEPSTWLLLGTGVLGLLVLAGRGRVKRRHVVSAMSLLGALLLLPAASHAQSSVTLSTTTTPSSAVSGGNVSITGSGFPSGSITPADVSVTVAGTCGGAGTSATPILVTDVLGPVYKVELTVPGLSAGTYYVSISGTTSTAKSFASSNCATLTVATGASTTLSINTTTSTCGPVGVTTPAGKNWEIKNGALDICFAPYEQPTPSSTESYANIISMYAVGSTQQLVDQTQTLPDGNAKGFYMDEAGFGDNTPQPGYTLTQGYLDWWVTYPSCATLPSALCTSYPNDYTISEHWVVAPNDSGFHVYFVVNHGASDPAGSVGQVQWVMRSDQNTFDNYYMANEDLSNPGPVQLGPLPTIAEFFGLQNPNPQPDVSDPADPGRDIQCATVDMHGYGAGNWSNFPAIASSFGRSFGDKYDYMGYNYLNFVHGTYGSEFGLWVVIPSNETLVGGPTKQMLWYTGNLDMIEAYSNHADNELSLATAKNVVSQRLFGPYYMRVNKFGMATNSNIDGGIIQTPTDMYDDAVAAGISFQNFYNNETELLANGYRPTTSAARGSVSIQINGVTGSPKTAWAVLSDSGKNHELSATGYQYWADISSTGNTTFTNVVPGTYRLSVYVLGKWGEFRSDGITVTAGQTTSVPTATWVPENFGSTIWTLGTPDRSSHEFLHGEDAEGHDNRQYWGNWSYWADFASTNGAMIYYATAVGGTPATNNLNAWYWDHATTWDPGLFAGYFCDSGNGPDTTAGYPCIIPSYVATLSGHSGTNGASTKIPAGTIYFATPANISSYPGGYVVLSYAIAAAEGNMAISLNGHSVSWTPIDDSDAGIRSGLSGYTEWAVYQWPVGDLNQTVGGSNTLTLTPSTNGIEDDALRMELTSTSAAQTATGWHDYAFEPVSGAGAAAAASDTVPNP
jgi:hypothetical protein